MTNSDNIKDSFLAPYAMRSGNSRGRAHSEEEHAYRDPFQRDRDRIIHSSAFRRLEKKTQVFAAPEGDYYRTRLTHTIEVSQISRTIARALAANEELAEAIALAHDLGHAPFGHTGEEALHELMAGRGGFEHNRQGLRVVDILESRYPDFPGLNLSFEVREGIIKHKTDYDSPNADGWEGPEGSPSIEAQIVNVADQITYTCHDVDDGLKANILSETILRGSSLCSEALDNMNNPALQASEKMRRYQLIRRLIDRLVTDLLETSRTNIASSNIASVADVFACPDYLVSFSGDMAARAAELKKLLYDSFYRDHRVVRMSYKARRCLTALFQAYVDNPDLLPAEPKQRAGDDTIHRVVCDYIAGMTDSYALSEFNRLFGPSEQI
ncbi:MAG: deoxyguanosinetriphosphate triphosphohydrolase [bacterium]